MIRRSSVVIALLIAGVVAGPLRGQEEGDYVRFLVPLAIGEQRGANGSQWAGELWLANDSMRSLREGSDVIPAADCVIATCIETIPPSTARRLTATELPKPVPALLLRVKSDVAGHIGLAYLFREMTLGSSQQPVPIVSEQELLREPAQLMVARPSNAAERTLLRVYDPDAKNGAALRIRIYVAESGELISDRIVVLNVPAEPAGPLRTYPGYAELPIEQALFTRQVFEKTGLRIRVDATTPEQRFWAMVSMTRNADNEVTLLTPEP